MKTPIVLSAILVFSSSAWAQDDHLASATSALGDVLSTLQDSVHKLSADNSLLAAKDNYIKNQMQSLEGKLQNLRLQGDALNKAQAPLIEKNDQLSKQINQLQQQGFDVDNDIQKDEADIKLMQRSMDAGYQEDERLLLQLKQKAPILSAPSQSQTKDDEIKFQTEKLKLIKMIYESRDRQAAIHQSILDYQKDTPASPAAAALGQQALLKAQINALQMEVSSYPSSMPASVDVHWDDEQLQQLEDELSVLEKDYHQLKDLMGQMNERIKGNQLNAGEQVEAHQLRGHIENLNNESQQLKVQLDDLRSQMVDLDKRKSHLEELIKQLP